MMPSHVDDNKPNTLGQDGGMLQSRLVYRRDVGSRKFQSLKLIRSKLTVPRCAFTPTRSAHSAQEPSVYRRKRWDIREGSLECPLIRSEDGWGKTGCQHWGQHWRGSWHPGQTLSEINEPSAREGRWSFLSSGPCALMSCCSGCVFCVWVSNISAPKCLEA